MREGLLFAPRRVKIATCTIASRPETAGTRLTGIRQLAKKIPPEIPELAISGLFDLGYRIAGLLLGIPPNFYTTSNRSLVSVCIFYM